MDRRHRSASRARKSQADNDRPEPTPNATLGPLATPAPDQTPSVVATLRPAGERAAAPVTEIELKLSIAPEDARRLGRVPSVRAASRGRARTRTLHSVYFDTPDFRLQREGVALRLRRDGTRWTQTLKSGGRVQGGLHLREELEVAVPAQILNYHALAASGVSPVFADPGLRASLQPVFTTGFRRTLRRLEPVPGTHVELCIDMGEISAGSATVPISEIELELQAGRPEALLDLAQALLADIPLRLEPASKAQRGYALAAGTARAPVKAEAPTLDPAMTVTEAFGAVVFGCLAHLQANERGVLQDDDAEYLHQARVALRRLRSAFSVFSRGFPRPAVEELIGELRWLGGKLGPARDWDVFATETLPGILSAFPGDSGLHALLERTTESRAAAGAVARNAVRSNRYTSLLLSLIATFYRQPWASLEDEAAAAERVRPLPDFAAAVLARRHRKVVKRGRELADLDAQGLHELRIDIKKARYAAEFFSALYDKKMVRDYTAALAGLQTLLGGLNDAATVERLCEELRDQREDPDGRFAEGIGLVRGWAGAMARAHLEQLPPAWEAFREVRRFC
jgi:inorganic triphosphatase YgiF